MMKRLLLAASLLSASLVFADSDRGALPTTPAQQVAKKVANLTRRLTLTAAQQAAATTIFTAEQTTLASLVTPELTAKTALQTAISVNDVPGINTAAATLGNLDQQHIVAEATAKASFYAQLTPTQQALFTAREADID